MGSILQFSLMELRELANPSPCLVKTELILQILLLVLFPVSFSTFWPQQHKNLASGLNFLTLKFITSKFMIYLSPIKRVFKSQKIRPWALLFLIWTKLN